MHEFDVLVLGEANADLIVQGQDLLPAFGREKLVQDLTLTVGGSASIFACQAAKLGLRTALIAIIGDDELGHFMRRALAGQGVDLRYVQQAAGLKTGATISLATPHDRALLTYPGTIAALDSASLDAQQLAAARHIHVASYFLQPALARGLPDLLAAARAAGSTVSLDTGWDPANRWDGGLAACLAQVDVLLPNQVEALSIARESSIDRALDRLAAQIPTVAIKLGPQGALARRGNERAQASPPPVQAIETTGAGDSFDAGFVLGHLQGLPLAASLELGVLCGSLSTRAAGGTTAQATLAELQSIRARE